MFCKALARKIEPESLLLKLEAVILDVYIPIGIAKVMGQKHINTLNASINHVRNKIPKNN